MSETPAPRGRPRDDGRRERVLEATSQYLLEHGLGDLNIRRLAKELNTSPRMLLYDFDSLAHLLLEATNRARQELAALTREQLAREPNPARAVEFAWEWFTEDANAGPAQFLVDVRTALVTGQLSAEQSAEPLLSAFLEFNAPPADLTLIFTVFTGLLQLHLHGQRDQADAAMRRFLTVVRVR